jgi:acetyl-CoA synthetase/medium-chain acyl-CoA synthetase
MGGKVSSQEAVFQGVEPFEWSVPTHYNFAVDTVDKWATTADGLALVWTNESGSVERYTFSDISQASNRVGNFLAKSGVRKGDFVLVMLPRVPLWHISMLALLKIGAIAVPCTTQLQPKDLQYRATFISARSVITDLGNYQKIEAIREGVPALQNFFLSDGTAEGWIAMDDAAGASANFEPSRTRSDEPALGYFTSGTAGGPKLVLHTHAYTWAHQITGKYWLALNRSDLHWNLSDTGWAKAAYSSLFGPWHMGTPIFVFAGAFVPTKVLEVLEQFAITTFCAPPTVFRVLVKEDLGRHRFALRHVVAAGEPLNPEVIRTWKDATGTTIYDGYGQTETIILVFNTAANPVKPGSMGKPAPGHYVGIVDEEGNELGPDEEGEIALKGSPPSLFTGYFNNPELTHNCRRGHWYVTGDRGFKDRDGYFWFVGRRDDVIISAGYRIGPFEVESALVTHPGVVESAVVASPDDVRGNIVKAFVVLRDGYKPSTELVRELQDHVKQVTAPYKYPREIEFIKELPKTVSGKTRRVELRRLEIQRKLPRV